MIFTYDYETFNKKADYNYFEEQKFLNLTLLYVSSAPSLSENTKLRPLQLWYPGLLWPWWKADLCSWAGQNTISGVLYPLFSSLASTQQTTHQIWPSQTQLRAR